MADKNLNSLNFGTGDTYYINAGNVKYDPDETFASGTVGAKFDEQSSRIATKAEKTALASTEREVALIRRAIDGQLMEIEEDHTEAYSKTLPSGTIGVGVNMIGGKSRVTKNLLDMSKLSPSTVLHYNAETGVFTQDSTAAFLSGLSNALKPSTIYTISAKVAGAVRLALSTSNITYEYGFKNFDANTSGSFQVTTPATITEPLGIAFYNSNFSEIAVSQLMIEEGSNATPYEPYFDGIISADCDEVVSEGKNLLNVEDLTVTSSGFVIDVQDVNFNAGNYTLSFDYVASATGSIQCSLKTNDQTVGTKIINNVQSGRISISITATSAFNHITLYSNGAFGTFKNVMFEKGSSATSYSPYMTDGFDIPQGLRTAHPLRSAGSAHDEYDFNGKFTKVVIGDVDLGSLNWLRKENNVNYAFETNALDAVIPKVMNSVPYNAIISNTYELVTGNKAWGDVIDKAYCFTASSYSLRIIDNSFTDAAAFKTAINGVHLYYELSAPLYYYDPTSPELAVNGGTVVPDATHIVDEESYFPTASNLLNAEAGGSITFHQDGDTEFPLPNSTDYFVKTTPSVA